MITGGIKFFKQSYALFKNGALAIASSNNEAAKYILSMNRYTEWVSIDSDDMTEEEIIIELDSSRSINRLFLTEFNFKEFEVTYWNGSSYVAFTNVVGVNGQTYTGINVTDYAYDSAYFEFDNVTTTRIKLTCLKTQIPNEQKYLCIFLVTEELGTFKGFPRVDPKTDMNEIKTKTLGGKVLVSKGFETVLIKLNFKTHPYQDDITLLEYLFSSVEPFLIYLCGGRVGENYFKIAQKTWNLSDVYNVQATGDLDSDFEKGVYLLGANKNITFEEHV